MVFGIPTPWRHQYIRLDSRAYYQCWPYGMSDALQGISLTGSQKPPSKSIERLECSQTNTTTRVKIRLELPGGRSWNEISDHRPWAMSVLTNQNGTEKAASAFPNPKSSYFFPLAELPLGETLMWIFRILPMPGEDKVHDHEGHPSPRCPHALVKGIHTYVPLRSTFMICRVLID